MNKIIVIGFAFLSIVGSCFEVIERMNNFIGFSTMVACAQQKDVEGAFGKANNHFQLGYKFLMDKKFDMAVKQFDEANKVYPTPVIYYFRGIALKFSKHYQAAIESFSKAIELGFDKTKLKDKEMDSLYSSRALSYFFLGKISEFVSDIEKVLELVPSSEMQYSRTLMHSYCMIGEYSKALKWADKIAEMDGMTEQTLKDKLFILMKLGRFDECNKIVKQLDQINPAFRFLNLIFVELYIEKGDLDNAEKSLRECYNYNKKKVDEWEYYRLKGKIEFLRKDYAAALKDIATQIRLVKIDKSFVIKTGDGDIKPWHLEADSFKLRGDIYLAMGNMEKALEDYQFFVSVSPHIADKEEVKKKIVQLRNKK